MSKKKKELIRRIMRKSYRVKKESEFQRVFNQGASFANRRFVVYFIEKPEQPHFRVGLSVGKKVGNAVTRNAVKRKIRASIYQMKDQLRSDIDFIVIARASCADLPSAEIYSNLKHVLKLAKIYQEENNA